MANLVFQDADIEVLPAHTYPSDLAGLCVSFNKLRILPMLPPFHHLQRLDLSHNSLAEVASLASSLPALTYLNVSHNRLRGLQFTSGLRALREVWAHTNRFLDAPSLAAQLGALQALEVAIVHENPMEALCATAAAAAAPREAALGEAERLAKGKAACTSLLLSACAGLRRATVGCWGGGGRAAWAAVWASLRPRRRLAPRPLPGPLGATGQGSSGSLTGPSGQPRQKRPCPPQPRRLARGKAGAPPWRSHCRGLE